MTDLSINQYLGKFSITIIKSKYHFLLASSLGVMIIISSGIMASNNVKAQTLETITNERKAFENNPQIKVGIAPSNIAINNITNKIYVTNARSGTVSVIDSNTGSTEKTIRVGASPSFIEVDDSHNKIYVANKDSNTVSVLDGNNDNEIGQIPVGKSPQSMAVAQIGKIYVANTGDKTVM